MKTRFKITGILIVLMAIIAISVSAQEPDKRFVGQVKAPEFPPNLDWLNVDAPLTIDGLHGKIILFDFWTYGCINCIHMIPIMQKLEERFPDELVIIGVHSHKFDNEGDTSNIRQIVERYQLTHPVINDKDFLVWKAYHANAWPSFVIVDPRGYVVAAQSGEVPYEAFEQYIAAMIDYYDTHPEIGTIDRTPRQFAIEGAGDPGTPLAFPGKVLADTAGNRLFIADTNHHRIVMADLSTYEVLATIGTGQRGMVDGAYDEAEFNQPQGMAILGNTLYVADTNNHAIRAVDLDKKEVSTVAGTGTMGTSLVDFSAVITDPTSIDLRSPWDLALGDNNILYIAMAGMHQIWQLDLLSNELSPAIGDGREAQVSGSFASSELAQPSGLHWHDGTLYFADSESSTVRAADTNTGQVRVLAGTTDNNLFDFGDVDGKLGESRLQHPLGVTANDDASLVYIADTYNSKIKVYNAATEETTTLFGLGGDGGYRDGDASVAQFDEPGGLDYANGLLYVADTNNHVIRIIDLEAGTVDTLQFPNPEALVINRDELTVLSTNAADAVELQYDAQTVAAGDGELNINFALPDGYHINELIDSTIEPSVDGDAVAFADNRFVIKDTSLNIPVTLSEGNSTISLAVTLYYCKEDKACLIDEATLILPVTVSTDGGTTDLTIDRKISLPAGLS